MKIVIFGSRCAPDGHWKLRKYTKNCMKMKCLVSDEHWKSKKHIKNCMKIIIFGIWCAPDVHWKLKKYTEHCMKMKFLVPDKVWSLRRSHFWKFSANRVASAGSDVNLGLGFINFKKLNLISVWGLCLIRVLGLGSRAQGGDSDFPFE